MATGSLRARCAHVETFCCCWRPQWGFLSGPVLDKPPPASWYTRSREGAKPYRLYALSNAGSMLALLSYPALVEPVFATTRQALGWSCAYVAVALLCGSLALLFGGEGAVAVVTAAPAEAAARPVGKIQALWSRSRVRVGLLLAVTNHISQKYRFGAVPVGDSAKPLPFELHPVL